MPSLDHPLSPPPQPYHPALVKDLFRRLEKEMGRAHTKYGPLRSLAEGRGALDGEVDELKTEFHSRDFHNMENEAIQVAAVAMRIVLDLCHSKHPERV